MARNYQPPSAVRRLLHGDLHGDHVFISGARLVGTVDWGDALCGDLYYELPALFFGTFGASKRLLSALRHHTHTRQRWTAARAVNEIGGRDAGQSRQTPYRLGPIPARRGTAKREHRGREMTRRHQECQPHRHSARRGGCRGAVRRPLDHPQEVQHQIDNDDGHDQTHNAVRPTHSSFLRGTALEHGPCRETPPPTPRPRRVSSSTSLCSSAPAPSVPIPDLVRRIQRVDGAGS
jgi:Phosphotransferase enzyme family